MNEIRTSGPLLFSEPDCPTRVGEIINTLSEIYDIPMPRLGMNVYVKDEKRTYIITELKSKTINGVVVPNAQVDKYRCVEDDIIKRIQGTSDASNAMTDPFKFVGSFNSSTIGNLRDWLDKLHGKDYTLDNRGVYRATLNDSPIEITSSPIAYGNETTSERYLQVVSGRVSVASSNGLITFGSEYSILTRVYDNNGWSAWRVVASADTLETLNNAITAEAARAKAAEQALRHFEPTASVFWSITGVGEMAKSTSGNYQSVIIPVIAGERYVVTATGAGNARTFATLDADKVCIRTNADDDYQFTNREITIKDGEAYLVVNSKNSVALVCHLTGSLVAAIKKEIENTAQNIDAGFKQIAYPMSENENYLTLEQGTIGNTGIDSPSDTYFRSNYIAIDGEPAIIANGSVLYRYYNEDKQFTGTEYTADSRFLRIVFTRRPSAYEKVYITTATATTEYAVSRFAGVAARSDVAYNGDFAIKELYIPQGVAGSVISEINSVRLQYTVSDGGYGAGFLFYNKSDVGVFQAMSYFDTAEEAADMLKRGFIDAPHCKVLFDVYNIVHNSNAYLKLDSKVSDLINSPTIAEFYCNDNLIEYGTENGYFIRADGKKVESTSYTTTEPIVLAKGYTIRVAAKNPNTVAAISVFNDGVYEPVSIGCSAGTVLLYEYTAGEDCLVVVSYMTSSGYVSVIGEMVSIVPELEFTMNYYMLSTGLVTGTTNNKFGYSSPFKVYRGDYLRLKLKASSTTAVLSKCDATGHIVDCVHKAVDEAETSYGYFVKEDGYMLVSGNVPTIELKIDRPNVARVALDKEIKSLEQDEEYKRKKHYYVDNVGFAPEVNSGILVYEGDTKSTHNFIANAVAYPDGTIIACRAADVEDRNGCVVRIDNEGNETVLLTIADATDWRCCFMDRNLNVYVSPHSSIRPNGVNMGKGDRGLYRLAYGSDVFEKVIQLYNPVGDSPVETENESNDDTIWTMCEDSLGNIYAGVYAHSTRPNPAIYKSVDGGVTWEYKYNFITSGMVDADNDRRGRARHIHSLIYNPYNFSLYCVVGEVETVYKSSDGGDTWIDLDVRVEDAKATAMIAVPDGVIMASDGNREGVISKLYADDRTVKTVGKMWHGIFFGIKRSDITGNIYALSRLESALQDHYPPRGAKDDVQILEDWKTAIGANKILTWQMYYDKVHKYYGHDEYMPTRYAVLMSRDNGESWEIIHSADTGYTQGEGCGIQCSGYFRNGELCCGVTNEVDGVKRFVNPVIISEGQKKYKNGKPDIEGEIFAKMNTDEEML